MQVVRPRLGSDPFLFQNYENHVLSPVEINFVDPVNDLNSSKATQSSELELVKIIVLVGKTCVKG